MTKPIINKSFRKRSNLILLYHPAPALRREWGIRSPLWGRSHTGSCSKDPSRLPGGGDNRLRSTMIPWSKGPLSQIVYGLYQMTDCLQVAKTCEHINNYGRKKDSIFAERISFETIDNL